jgi:hypothetical protein
VIGHWGTKLKLAVQQHDVFDRAREFGVSGCKWHLAGLDGFGMIEMGT